MVVAERIAESRDLLRNAKRLFILTGSGISVASGIPTFRGSGTDKWSGFSASTLGSVKAFDRDPCQVWEWYEQRRRQAVAASPNAGHVAVAKLIRDHGIKAVLVTQNVDGLHRRASLALDDTLGAEAVVEFHGSLHFMKCRRCNRRQEVSTVDYSSKATLPTCAVCGKFMRPDIVWFNEQIKPSHLQLADSAARVADVCLVVGTGLEVYPAADFPNHTLRAGGQVVEVNPKPAMPIHPDVISIAGPAADVLPQLVD